MRAYFSLVDLDSSIREGVLFFHWPLQKSCKGSISFSSGRFIYVCKSVLFH